ncbi:hypothetical protein Dimus_018235 [Dionaea muscipula]
MLSMLLGVVHARKAVGPGFAPSAPIVGSIISLSISTISTVANEAKDDNEWSSRRRQTKQRKLLFLSRSHRRGDDIPGVYLTRRETVEIDKGVSSTANGESKGQYWLDSGDDTDKDEEVLRYFLAQVEAGSLLSITVAFSWQKAARMGPRFMVFFYLRASAAARSGALPLFSTRLLSLLSQKIYGIYRLSSFPLLTPKTPSLSADSALSGFSSPRSSLPIPPSESDPISIGDWSGGFSPFSRLPVCHTTIKSGREQTTKES